MVCLPRWIRSAIIWPPLVAVEVGVVVGAVLPDMVHLQLSRWAAVVAKPVSGETLRPAAGAVALVIATAKTEVR